MLELTWLIPALPFAGFTLLALVGSRLPKRTVAWVGAGSIGLSALVAAIVGVTFFVAPPADHAFGLPLWSWVQSGNFAASFGLHLDPLSIVMVLVVTWVAFLIHLYSAEYMGEDEDYSRFFAYMNLFVGSMLVLVLANNLLWLYLGWEGVGLCSYLLIGFWYRDPVNGRAAIKAFVVTRVGDAALALGLFLLYVQLGTLNIAELSQRALVAWHVGAPVAVAAALLLLGGAVGKSAQLPLQTWLPDAMAGPTPVSALIHAATMVTAGVYLIARMHVIFELAPAAQLVVAIVGAATLFLAAVSALAQWDVKRVLAYSTISQIGYMFLGLGVGAWSAAIFHFMTHAFFKSLLFLGAGSLLYAMDDEHSIFKMGGLRRKMPLTFWTFLAGVASLSALPLVTAGFYSKDQILAAAYANPTGGLLLWAVGLAGAFLTAIYSFRIIFFVFYGPVQKEPERLPGRPMGIALVVLAALAIVGGVVNLPPSLGNWPVLGHFLSPVWAGPLAAAVGRGPLSVGRELGLESISGVAALLGVLVSWLLYLRFRSQTATLVANPTGRALRTYWLEGWGFDWLYDWLLVRPFRWFAETNRGDVVDLLYDGLAGLTALLHRGLSLTQTGRVRWYVTVITFAAFILVAIVVLR